MGRHSDDSDSESEYSRKKAKKKKSRKSSRSKSRDKRSRSRNRRSRSRSRRSKSRTKDRRTRSRDRRSRDRRSRSRDNRSKEHYRKRSQSRSRDRSSTRNRRSRNRSRSRESSSRSRTMQPELSPPPPPAISTVGPEVIMTIADELKRARAIADIESDSFVQKDFQTNYSKVGEVQEDGKFDFGTSAEMKSKTQAEEAMEKLNREGLFHPMLFGDQEKREARFLQHVWTIRQRAVKALQQQN